METRELLPNRLLLMVFVATLLMVTRCTDRSRVEMKVEPDYSINTTNIPKDTLALSDERLSIVNGVYLLNAMPFSGTIKETYGNGAPKSYRSVLAGTAHGSYRSYYEGGEPFEVRMYKNNMATGRHYGYWPDGKTLKFDYHYYEEKRQGAQKKWYTNGRPYLFANYKDDHEDGLQQGWRENRKLFINYVAREGHTYGMQQTALCYSLLDEKIKAP